VPCKNVELPIFDTFTANSRFFGLLFHFTIYKTIKSSRYKLTFMIIMTNL